MDKGSAYNAGDLGSIPGSGRSPEGNGNPLQCSCLENPRDGEAWWAAIYGVAQSRTRLKLHLPLPRGPSLVAPPVAQRLKRLPPMTETRVRSLGQEDPLKKEMAIHSSVLAWRIPGTRKPGGLLSMGSHRVGHD